MTTEPTGPGQPADNEADAAVRVAGVFFVYLITARIGLGLHDVNTFATLIWPPSGIALAAFILYGSRVWPAIFCAAFLTYASLGAPLLIALGIGIGNTVGPALGAYLLAWYASYSPHHAALPRMAENIGIMASAAGIPMLTATAGTSILWLGDLIAEGTLVTTWVTWWLGDMLGILLLTPFIVTWFNRPLLERSRMQQIELAVMISIIAAVSYFVFWVTPISFVYYILFIPLAWAAFRTGTRGITLAMVIVASIAISGTITGHSRFAAEGLLYLQLFLMTMAGIFLAFSSAVEGRKKAFDTLEQHTRELEIALQTIRSEDEAKKEFIAILAHELRNPLATILSSIELIKMQGASAPNTGELLTAIDERSRAMVRLLDDLLDISRISKKKLMLQKETISVDQFMDKLGAIVRPLMKRYGHQFSLIKPEEGLYLRADPIRLEQILMNLLANAARYTKTRGSIEVISRKDGHMLAIHIRDSGVGIPKGMLRRIFEPFFQVTRDQVPNEGIGVGLTLTRELIEMHGGRIEVQSEGVGTGSEFIVRLPLTRAPDDPTTLLDDVPLAPIARPYVRTPGQVKRTFKILVVDDNEMAADALSQLLSMRGHETAVAYAGASALEEAERFVPDVIFLDIGLPDMSGYDVAVAMRKERKTYFIVALTGYGQDDDKDKARRSGIDQHLTKPAGIKEIQAVLRKVPRSARNDAG